MDYRTVDEIDYFFKKFGEITYSEPVDAELIEKYTGILPEWFIGYWKKYGFFSVMDGLYWAVNPEEYQDILKTWLPEEQAENCYVLARSGWGELVVWQPEYGDKYEIDPLNGWVFQENINPLLEAGYANKAAESVFTGAKVEHLSADLFKECVQAYGPLKENEMFTFVPPLFIGGEKIFKNVKKVDLFIQMDILAQLAEPKIIDINDLRKMAFGR
ncbi:MULTISPECIES: GAD-like domain-containing protein [Pasteurellaceae]|uniref:Glutamyl-tRNA amidotransferase n=1 Tax=Rodentibacter rarus TaxID=1908260 RepID=A0A1V3IFE4_9PAST|nr:GAD-like domain-containing protein [Rodentibacter rarus]OOF35616.1 hypothetical protein BKK49_12390 [Rodentibacter rarus]OOF39493.1 hypothetical protein BKK50_10600 [Rodentibacter rarus]